MYVKMENKENHPVALGVKLDSIICSCCKHVHTKTPEGTLVCRGYWFNCLCGSTLWVPFKIFFGGGGQ